MRPVKKQVDYNVFDQAQIQVRNQARPLVWVRVFELVWQQVKNQARDQVEAQMKSKIR